MNYFCVHVILDFNLDQKQINKEMLPSLIQIVLRNNYNLLNYIQYKTNIKDLEDTIINVCINNKISLIIESMNDKK
jgi:hypothetical protein